MNADDAPTPPSVTKPLLQRVVECAAWVVLIALVLPFSISAVGDLQHGYWFFPALIAVILVLAVSGLVLRWGVFIPATLASAWFGLLPRVNGDTVSELKSGIIAAILGAFFGAIVDASFRQTGTESLGRPTIQDLKSASVDVDRD